MAVPAEAHAGPPYPNGGARPTLSVDVTQAPYRAVGNGTTNDRLAIQAAIDDVAQAGGGTVVVPAGRTFLTGSLDLRSHVRIQLDGTLLESQNDADYATAPTHGHIYPSTIAYRLGNLAMLHNPPLILAANAKDVAVTGAGTIQLTRAAGATPAASEDATIHLAGIGFYRVDGFEISGISLLGASSFSLALYTTSNGLVHGTRIISTKEDRNPVGGENTDGISIQNSQHLRITGNVVHSGDDGIYVWASYRDERGGATSWWSSDEPRPSFDIEIDHNEVVATHNDGTPCCSAVALIAWGGGGAPTGGNAPDQRTVEISDVSIHDNHLEAGYPFRLWSAAAATQSPLSRITLARNVYVWGLAPGANLRGQITDFTSDDPQWYQYVSARTVKNGTFESTGDAWWTPSGQAGATNANAPALDDPAFRARLAEASGWVGYLRTVPHRIAGLEQAFRPTAPEDLPPIGVDVVHHTIAADVVTNGRPVVLAVRSRCDGKVLAESTVTAQTWTHVTMAFDLTSPACASGVRLELRSSNDSPGWAMIDNVSDAVSYAGDGNWIDSADPRVQRAGSWATYAGATDVGGNHLVGLAAGANLTVPFTGTRARLLATVDVNLGLADIYVDGAKVGTADFYAATRKDGVVVYDTGTLPAGDHVFELRTTGTKNPKSTSIYTVFDALLVP